MFLITFVIITIMNFVNGEVSNYSILVSLTFLILHVSDNMVGPMGPMGPRGERGEDGTCDCKNCPYDDKEGDLGLDEPPLRGTDRGYIIK